MKMLIVDNEPRRYKRLKNEILTIDGISSDDLLVVSNIEDAKEKIESLVFDIVLLDILIPYSNVDEDDKQNCIEFLEFLHDGCTNRPHRIIGITSDACLIEEMKDIFSSKAWVVFKYSDTDDQWLMNILACVKYIFEEKPTFKPLYDDIDILVICALLDPELIHILDLPWNWQKPILIDDNIFIYLGSININGRIFKIAATYAFRMGMVATAITCSRLIPLMKPKIVTMTGICGGNREEVNLGDVIVAEASWNYQSGKLIKEDGEVKFKVAPHHLNIKSKVKNFFIQLSRNPDLLKSLKVKVDGQEISPIIKIGSLVSGTSVIADDITLKTIKEQQDKNVYGIEMEIYGLYDACSSANSKFEPIFFALKGVCDYADSMKNTSFQNLAAKNSAIVFESFVHIYIDQII